METQRRTLTKSLLWSLLGLIIMAAIGVVFTGSVAVGGAMALVNTVIGFVTYLVYERIWTRISWGRV